MILWQTPMFYIILFPNSCILIVVDQFPGPSGLSYPHNNYWIHEPRINTFRPRQHGRHFADDTFKRIFLNENLWISIKISLKFVPKSPIDNIPALFQIMAWRRPGDKPLSEAMMVSLQLGLNELIYSAPPNLIYKLSLREKYNTPRCSKLSYVQITASWCLTVNFPTPKFCNIHTTNIRTTDWGLILRAPPIWSIGSNVLDYPGPV